MTRSAVASTQFLSRDPLMALTRERYSYAGGTPLNRRDPSGLASTWLAMDDPRSIGGIVNPVCDAAVLGGAVIAGIAAIGGGLGWILHLASDGNGQPIDCPDPSSDASPGNPEKPSLPEGAQNNREFGEIMKWGRGDAEALAAREDLTKEYLDEHGVTAEIAREWRDFYLQEKSVNPMNPSAQGRAALMQHALDLLGG